MSGSNALAAAKRRRGGSEPKPPAPPGSQRNPQNNSPTPPGIPPGALNPLQLVAINHQRLNKLSEDLPKSIDALGESFNALSSNCDFLHDQFTVLEQKVNSIMSNQSTSNVSSGSVTSGMDMSKFNQLKDDVDEVHRVITRMQSFAMELSNGLSKSKEQLDNYTNNVNANVNQLTSRVDSLEQKINHLYSVEQRLVDTNNRLDTLDQMFENLVNSHNQVDEEDGNVNEQVESQEVEVEAELE